MKKITIVIAAVLFLAVCVCRAAPLHDAVKQGDFVAAEKLLADGADVNVADYMDQTPLHNAAANGNLASARLLLEAGADPHATDANGKTPLDLAVENQLKPLIDLLGRK